MVGHFSSLPFLLKCTESQRLLRLGWVAWILLVVKNTLDLNAEWVFHVSVNLNDVLLVVAGVGVQLHDGQLFGVLNHLLSVFFHHFRVKMSCVQERRSVHQVESFLLLGRKFSLALDDPSRLAEFIYVLWRDAAHSIHKIVNLRDNLP